MPAQESWHNIGRKIRYLRKTHQLTIKQLAVGCGLSANAISLLERGEVAPTVATLCKIAAALGASPGSFFQEVCPNAVVYTRAEDHHPEQAADQAIRALTCSLGSAMNLADLAEDGTPTAGAYSPEYVLCLNGQIEYEANGHCYRLKPGDSLAFNGNVLHCWRNRGSGTAVAVMVINCQPQERNLELADSAAEGD
ncbi:MAG: XRE family transcriptional regulator [Chloroflexota bacterium]